MAAALACSRAGWGVQVFERSGEFAEVGAGIQMGPNVTRLLHAWGLAQPLARVGAFPTHLQVRGAVSGRELGALRLGATARDRYGAPYVTLHRADLHRLLLDAVRQQTDADLRLGQALTGFTQTPTTVSAQVQGVSFEGDVLLGADGLWSVVRQCLLNDGPPRVTGHLAYRALVPQAGLPSHLRSQHITAWLGPGLHLVQYPVRGGEWLNVVAIVHGTLPSAGAGCNADGDSAGANPWDHGTDSAILRRALEGCCRPLQDLVAAIADWRLWVLCDRAPMQGPQQHGGGRVALLGDAAHPMRPYLAQGAGMAIEDAAELGRVLACDAVDVPSAVHLYGQRRWQRNARVQARAVRNGQIFHARGWVQWGRDRALELLGERLLDLPWLYGH